MKKLAFGALLLAACASARDDVSAPPAPAAKQGIDVDRVEIVRGIADRGRDPAVVAIDIAGEGLCTGTLIAADVVLTARHCVAHTTEEVACPPRGPQVTTTRRASTLGILVGEDVEHAALAARGRLVLAPEGDTLCGADIAAIVLDRPVLEIKPLLVRTTGVAAGDHVRAVGFGIGEDGAAGTKLLRAHVRVLGATASEFIVGEATCQGDSGGPALDEDTGEIVGVVSRGGPSCEGSGVHNIYTRADAFLDLVNEALAKARTPPPDDDRDGGDDVVVPRDAGKPKKPGRSRPPTDIGGACSRGSDCAAGVCVRAGGGQYCSRTCGKGDRCPNGYHCEETASGSSVCIQK